MKNIPGVVPRGVGVSGGYVVGPEKELKGITVYICHGYCTCVYFVHLKYISSVVPWGVEVSGG